MKVCQNCGIEIDGRDGDNLCRVCDENLAFGRKRRNSKARKACKAREQAMLDCGLAKVRSALGGAYWE